MGEKQKLGYEPAFPTDVKDSGALFNKECMGMSKRFYAACAAMQGIVANQDTRSWAQSYQDVIASAYKHADELLKQENQ